MHLYLHMYMRKMETEKAQSRQAGKRQRLQGQGETRVQTVSTNNTDAVSRSGAP